MNEEQNKNKLTHQVVVFELDKEEYAVPIGEVREVIKIPEITPVPNSPTFILGILNLRGRVVPVIDLEKRFELQRENRIDAQHVLVAELGEALMGVKVDTVKEVLQTYEEDLKPVPKMVSSKIGEEYLKGVLVIEKKEEKSKTNNIGENVTAEEEKKEDVFTRQRVLLLIDLAKILSTEELAKTQSLVDKIEKKKE